jgi:hypothetical protein
MHEHQKAIIKRLQAAPATQAELRGLLGITTKELSNRLYGLKSRGAITRTPGGRYALTEGWRAAPMPDAEESEPEPEQPPGETEDVDFQPRRPPSFETALRVLRAGMADARNTIREFEKAIAILEGKQ